jgi:hypothetical protein
MSAADRLIHTRMREVTAEEVGRVALKARETRTAPVTRRLHRTEAGLRCAPVVDDLITELGLGRIRSVAFVVLGEARWTLPLYEIAITTARRGWSIGIADARYWFITSEPVPLAGFGPAARAGISARLEPEGITFIGSTFADLRPGVVLLDPQGELLEVDRVVTLSDAETTNQRRAARSSTGGGSARRVASLPRR